MTAAVKVTERQWQDQVLEVAHLTGWRTYHTHDSRRSAPGWPDLALCRPPRLLLVELKTDVGRVSPAQAEWLEDLGRCAGVEVYIWRPADLDTVVATLRR